MAARVLKPRTSSMRAQKPGIVLGVLDQKRFSMGTHPSDNAFVFFQVNVLELVPVDAHGDFELETVARFIDQQQRPVAQAKNNPR